MIAGGRYRVATVCRVLGVARSNVIERRSRGSAWFEQRGRDPVDDPQLLDQLRDLAAQRPHTAIGDCGRCCADFEQASVKAQ